jgi:hypothetical protein
VYIKINEGYFRFHFFQKTSIDVARCATQFSPKGTGCRYELLYICVGKHGWVYVRWNGELKSFVKKGRGLKYSINLFTCSNFFIFSFFPFSSSHFFYTFGILSIWAILDWGQIRSIQGLHTNPMGKPFHFGSMISNGISTMDMQVMYEEKKL